MYCSCCGLTCCWWCRLCCCCWWWSCCSLRSPGCSCCSTRLCWLLLWICTAACCPFPWADAGTNTNCKSLMLNVVFISPSVKKSYSLNLVGYMYGTLVYIRTVWSEYRYWTKEREHKDIRFWPLLTVPGGTLIFTGVTELGSGSTLLLAAFGLCLGAMEVSVGPTESVILQKIIHKLSTIPTAFTH